MMYSTLFFTLMAVDFEQLKEAGWGSGPQGNEESPFAAPNRYGSRTDFYVNSSPVESSHG